MKRIQNFLLCDQIDEKIIQRDDGSSELAFEIDESTNFHWGFEKKEEKKVDTKKAKKGKKDDDYKKL